MNRPNKSSKSRLRFALGASMILVIGLLFRLAYLQIVIGEDLKKGALEQWTKSIDIKSERGIIYDRKGKKMAVSINAFTVWATPREIKKPEETAKQLSEILDIGEEIIYDKITKNQNVEKIKQWISREEAEILKDLRLAGISVVDDNKRFYPYGNFASYILGFTDVDNNGLDGVEKTFDKYLKGTPGRWIKMTDAANRQLPYDGEKIYESKDGNSLVLTIDETIQHFVEKAVDQALIDQKAKSVSVILMDPNTGDILAMASKPDFDPNNPREPLDDNLKAQWQDLPMDQLQDKWYELWRNVGVSDIYEPGSTFKLITTAVALEENVTSVDSPYYCDGFIRVQGRQLRCASWYDPHGHLTFREGLNDSCNIVFVNVGREIGKENFYKYIKGFGFGEKTNIDLLGEQPGIIPSSVDAIKEINLATMSYGHGIAVTPIQLVTAVSAISNGGNLMKPRIVKQLINDNGEIIREFPTEIKRQVISKQTSDTMLSMMETAVTEGSGRRAIVPGYKIGGKTGTAEKIIDGRYAKGKYIGSFIAVAPIDDPKIAILVIVDEPNAGTHYGGTVAAPVAKSILEQTFNYLEIAPTVALEDGGNVEESIEVPDVRDKNIGEAGRVLAELGLRYTMEYVDFTSDTRILDQFPAPGAEVEKGSIIDLFLDTKSSNYIKTPYLIEKSKEEVIRILDEMNLQYNLQGEGNAVLQNPMPGEEVDSDMKIQVEFKRNSR